jgi:hypothetical protein
MGLVEDLDAVKLEDPSDGRGHDSEEEDDDEERRGSMRGRRGTTMVWGCTMRGWGGGDGSALGSASSHRFRTSHLFALL